MKYRVLLLLMLAPALTAGAEAPPARSGTQICQWQNIQVELTMDGGPKVQEQSVQVSLSTLSGDPILTEIAKGQLKMLAGTRAWVSLWPKTPNLLTGSAKLAFDPELIVELILKFPGIKLPSIYFQPFAPRGATLPCSHEHPASKDFTKVRDQTK